MIEILVQPRSPALTAAQVPADRADLPRPAADDPLSTVGLALLAYGLVQLLSKFIDKLVLGRPSSDQRGVAHDTGFTEEDRKRAERTCELLVASDQRSQRIAEAAVIQQKLVGQALDELRDASRKHDNLARKLNAVWNRIGSRKDDGK